VLVTDAQGNESVQEIKEDVGRDLSKTGTTVKRIQLEGQKNARNASTISFADNTQGVAPPPPPTREEEVARLGKSSIVRLFV
jgi:hypothetical protein